MGSAHDRNGNWAQRPDAELVAGARTGSPDAFAELYRRHAPATRLAISDHVDDREQQRDLVQEVFTRALTRLDDLREADRFRPWVLQIARNAAVDDLRRRKAVRHEVIDDEDSPELPSDDPDPELEAEVRQLAEAIQSNVAALSPRDATALSLTVHLGFGPAEVAAALDITTGNAKVVLHRARRRLRAALEQQALLEASAS